MAAIVEKTEFDVTYNGKSITRTISKMLVRLSFEDTVEDTASTLEIELENEDELWSNGWYPEKGATISASIGNLSCGKFTIDCVELRGLPDRIIIHCIDHITTDNSVTLKTHKSKAHEKKSLRQIAQHVAQQNNLTLVGTVPDIMFERVTQHKETDLKFLRRVGFDYGIIFTVRDKKLVFTSIYDIEKRPASFVLDKKQMSSYSVKDKTYETFNQSKVLHHNPRKKKIITYSTTAAEVSTVQNHDGVAYTQITASDTQVIHKRVESEQQAQAISKAHLYRANTRQQEAEFAAPGSPLAVAGNNFGVTGLGVIGSGLWSIRKVSHTLDRDGDWQMTLDTKRIDAAGKDAQRGSRHKSVHHRKGSDSASNGVPHTVTKTNQDGVQYTEIE